MTDAGFRAPRLEELTFEWRYGAEHLWDTLRRVAGPLAAVIKGLPGEDQQETRAAIEEALAQYRRDGELVDPAAYWASSRADQPVGGKSAPVRPRAVEGVGSVEDQAGCRGLASRPSAQPSRRSGQCRTRRARAYADLDVVERPLKVDRDARSWIAEIHCRRKALDATGEVVERNLYYSQSWPCRDPGCCDRMG